MGFTFPQFTPALGTLTSVEVISTFHATGRMYERAVFGPILFSDSLALSVSFLGIRNGEALFGYLNYFYSASSTSYVLQQGEVGIGVHDFSDTLSVSITNPATLSLFVGGDDVSRISLGGSLRSTSFFGDTALTMNATTTIRYSYSVTDDGSTIVLLTAALLACLTLPRLYVLCRAP
jgi:hypothetical protein